LEIPFSTFDVQQPFYEKVVLPFIQGYAQGITPNPCLYCNRYIRFGLLLKLALEQGADYLATGHYVRLSRDDQGRQQMLTAVDGHKDQTYVLSILTQEQLVHTLFPLGGYRKSEVRLLAHKYNLPVAERGDSQDLCFLGGGDYREFLHRHVSHMHNPGPIMTMEGGVIGEHQGLAFYTIGQRKGLNIAATHPFYVLDKDIARNVLIVGQQNELGKRQLTACQINWIAGEAPIGVLRVQVKIRYNAPKIWGTLTPLDGGRVHVQFENPLRDITPGQAAVFYDSEVCLGSSIIESAK
jgi:tRNA-specific 2-thiouridylase